MYPLISTSIYCILTAPFVALYALIHLPRARALACAKMRSGLELSGEEEKELKTHRRRACGRARTYALSLSLSLSQPSCRCPDRAGSRSTDV